MYMEIFFPEHGVRYIAINDGYDSNEQSQMDIAPFETSSMKRRWLIGRLLLRRKGASSRAASATMLD